MALMQLADIVEMHIDTGAAYPLLNRKGSKNPAIGAGGVLRPSIFCKN